MNKKQLTNRDRNSFSVITPAIKKSGWTIVENDEQYIMRITGGDEIGKKQLDNFRDVGSKYPILVTTLKLLTTGVDAQMVKFIVLDANINSMTEFKQIIGRGTRVREDLNKLYLAIFDFRNAASSIE